MNIFPTDKSNILFKLNSIDPIQYGKTRNYIDGKITYLSPYISRGILTTKQIFNHIVKQSYTWDEIEIFVKELAWRDFFQSQWKYLSHSINNDIKQPQKDVVNHLIPSSIVNANTGVHSIDESINLLYSSGYMHNHCRMYTASLVCNFAHSHWKYPAKWMYYYLLDADWASNACSWQWVAGSFSNKQYIINQENINRYTYSQQKNTFLDMPYELLPVNSIPESLKETIHLDLHTILPESTANFSIDVTVPTLLYNWYNIDHSWHTDITANRILLIEPSIFKEYPISTSSMNFMLNLAKNIDGIQVLVGEFSDLYPMIKETRVIYKEHPLNKYIGFEESRECLISIDNKYFGSFFSYWKHIEPFLYALFKEETTNR
jgi:deoxyribodipyrimidine photo-lyase